MTTLIVFATKPEGTIMHWIALVPSGFPKALSRVKSNWKKQNPNTGLSIRAKPISYFHPIVAEAVIDHFIDGKSR